MSETKVALVTGANTGIGFAIGERLQRDGLALVFATHEHNEQASSAFERLRRRSPVHWVAGDLADPHVPARLVREGLEAFGRVDVLVNNAGLGVAKPALALGTDDFDALFAVDVRAPFLLAKAAADPMRAQGGGVIVNVTSVHEHVPRPGFLLYSAAKAALGMLTRGLALELGEHDIRVNAVAPGAIATERNVEADELQREVPLRRAGRPEEVASLVSYLVSDEAAYVTGASVLIDGGLAQQVVTHPAS